MNADEPLEDLRDPETLPQDIVEWQPTHGRLVDFKSPGAAMTAVGAAVVAAAALGALAVGTMAIGRLVIGRSRIRRLEIDKLVVGELKVLDR